MVQDKEIFAMED